MSMNTTTLTILGRRLRAARTLAGLDQAGIASLLKVGRSTVSNWETGISEPQVTEFARWAHITGQSIEWLLEGVLENEITPAVNDEGDERAPRDSNPRPSDLESEPFPTAAELIELWAVSAR